MSIDLIVDLLRAISCQYDGNEVRFDGESYFIEEVCEYAIGIIISLRDKCRSNESQRQEAKDLAEKLGFSDELCKIQEFLERTVHYEHD